VCVIMCVRNKINACNLLYYRLLTFNHCGAGGTKIELL